MHHIKCNIFVGLFVIMTGLLSACSTFAPEPKANKAEMTRKAMKSHKPVKLEIYEVHHDGRIHVFYSKKLYKEFMQLGETSFRLTRIGVGPHGETMVFGLEKKDKKLKKPVAAIELYDGKLKPDAFYAEMHKHGRIYVFNNFKDMKTVRDFGHPNFMFTQIGDGPKGETVVFVLNSKNKKKRPDALIAEFKKRNF